jgi:hypothetical protein
MGGAQLAMKLHILYDGFSNLGTRNGNVPGPSPSCLSHTARAELANPEAVPEKHKAQVNIISI